MVTKKTKVLVLSVLAMAIWGVSGAIFAAGGQVNSLDSAPKVMTTLSDGDVLIQDQNQNQHSSTINSSPIVKISDAEPKPKPKLKLKPKSKPKTSLNSSLAPKLSHTHALPAVMALEGETKTLPSKTASVSEDSAAPVIYTTKKLPQKTAEPHKKPFANEQLASPQTKEMMPKAADGGDAPKLAASSSPVLQLEMEIDKNASYKIFSLPKPDRLVVDVKNSEGKTEFDKASFANTVVKNIRTSQHPNGIFRIVFDLKEKLAFATREMLVDSNGSMTKKLVISLFDEKNKKDSRIQK